MSSYLDSPSAPEPPGFVEQRLFLRKKVEAPMPIELLPGKEVWLYDLGEGGLSVSGSSRLEPGTATFLDFQFPDLNSVIEAAGVVAWCDNSGRVGVRFTRIKPDSTAVLKRWLKSDRSASSEQTAGPALRVPELSGLISRAQFEISDLRTQLAAPNLDSDSALKLMVERMAYHTRATGAAIAWRDGDDVVCRASHGNAPDVGVKLNLEGSLSGECYRTGNIVSLADSEHDLRVDAELCRQLDFRSLLIVPVMSRDDVVVGIAEVFSSTPGNFEGGDVLLLSSIAELIGDLYDRTQPPASAADSETHRHQAEETVASVTKRGSSSIQKPSAADPFVPAGFELADTKSDEHGPDTTEASSGKIEHAFGEERPDDPSSKSRRVLLGALLLAGSIGAGGYSTWHSSHSQVAAHPQTAPSGQPVVVPIASLPERQPQPTQPATAESSAVPAGLAEAASIPNRNPGKRVLAREESVESNFAAGLAGHLRRTEPVPDAPSLIASDHSAFRVDTTYFLPARAPQVRLLKASLQPSQVTAGRLLHRVNPVFPQFAKTAGLHGSVVIAATIGTDGRLKNMKLISGNGALAVEAFRAARQWVYAPYRLNGQPIEVDARIVMDFDRP